MSNFVRFVTSWLGVPPWRRTTSKASARDMQARRPVKATELLSAELSNSTGVMSPRPLPCSESLLAGSLFSRPTSLCAGCRRLLFLRIDAGPKGIDQIDHVGRWGTPNRRDLFARLFLLKEVNEGVLVVVLEVRRIEVARLVADDVTCKVEHVLGELQLRNILEVRLFISHFIRISKRHAQQAPASHLKCNNVLPAGQDDPTERDHIHFADGVSNDCKSILPDLTIGGDVIRRVDIAVIDLISRNEPVDLDGPSALDLHGL